jgi:hypothetical protein
VTLCFGADVVAGWEVDGVELEAGADDVAGAGVTTGAGVEADAGGGLGLT